MAVKVFSSSSSVVVYALVVKVKNTQGPFLHLSPDVCGFLIGISHVMWAGF